MTGHFTPFNRTVLMTVVVNAQADATPSGAVQNHEGLPRKQNVPGSAPATTQNLGNQQQDPAPDQGSSEAPDQRVRTTKPAQGGLRRTGYHPVSESRGTNPSNQDPA